MKALLLASAAVLASPVAYSAEVTARLCGGSPGGIYSGVAKLFENRVPEISRNSLRIEALETAAGTHNLDGAEAGECEFFLVQGNLLPWWETRLRPDAKDKLRLVAPLYDELMLLLVPRSGSVDDLGDAVGKKVAAGSGAGMTLLQMQEIAPKDYRGISLVNRGALDGAMAVLNSEAVGLLEVAAPAAPFLKTLYDNPRVGDKFYLGQIDNSSLADYTVQVGLNPTPQKVFKFVEVDDDKLFRKWSTNGDPETLAVTAYIGVNTAWAAANPRVMSAMNTAILQLSSEIEALAYGPAGVLWE